MNELLFPTQQDTDETNRISPAMDNTRAADTFSQVKAQSVMGWCGSAARGDGFGNDFVLYWRGVCSRV